MVEERVLAAMRSEGFRMLEERWVRLLPATRQAWLDVGLKAGEGRRPIALPHEAERALVSLGILAQASMAGVPEPISTFEVPALLTGAEGAPDVQAAAEDALTQPLLRDPTLAWVAVMAQVQVHRARALVALHQAEAEVKRLEERSPGEGLPLLQWFLLPFFVLACLYALVDKEFLLALFTGYPAAWMARNLRTDAKARAALDTGRREWLTPLQRTHDRWARLSDDVVMSARGEVADMPAGVEATVRHIMAQGSHVEPLLLDLCAAAHRR